MVSGDVAPENVQAWLWVVEDAINAKIQDAINLAVFAGP